MQNIKLKLMYWLMLISYLVLCIASTFAQDISSISQQKPFAINGNIGVNYGYYQQSGFSNTQAPHNYGVAINLTPSIYGISLPFNFIYAQNNKNFTQPFNQFGIAPQYKWAKLHLGYSNLQLAPSVLGGKTILGAGFELHPKKLRIAFVAGQLNAKRIEDTAYVQLPQYRRLGYAGKIGVGSENNYFDIVFLKGYDDNKSLDSVSTTYKETVTPKENIVGGINSKFTIKQHIVFENDASITAYSRDTRLKALPVNSSVYAKYGNAIMLFITPRLSTSTSYYIHSNLRYQKNTFSLGLDYKLIAPQYYSMGLDYLYEDVENIQVQSNFGMLKNKLFVAASIGQQKDNVYKNKEAQTFRTVYNIALNYTANKYLSIAANYNNFGVSQRDGRRKLNDTIRMDNANTNFSITPTLFFNGKNKTHIITCNYNYMLLDDKNNFTKTYTNSTLHTGMLNYGIQFLAKNFTINNCLTYTNILLARTTILNYGYGINLQNTFFKQKLNTNVGYRYLLNHLNSKATGSTQQSTIQIGFIPHQHHQFRITGSLLFNQNKTTKNTSEQRIDVGYIFSF